MERRSVVKSTVQLCDADTLSGFDWPADSEPFRRWVTELVTETSQETMHGSQKFISNVSSNVLACRVDQHLLPITVNQHEYYNAYVCSPYNGVITYPLFELREVKGLALQIALRALINSVAPVLRTSSIDRAVCVNNWMLSTNLYGSWDGVGLGPLRDELIERFPSHAILFRSLNGKTDQRLLRQLQDAGFLLAPSRQVYVVDESESQYLGRQNCRWDRKLLMQGGYSLVMGADLTHSDDARIKQLYDMLYIDKYTSLNPQFTERLIRIWRETNALTFIGLKNPAGVLDGIIGCFSRDQTLTVPLVGYDTRQPREAGLYRMLMALAFQEASRRGVVLNLSSGAAHFKRIRGARPFIEYTAIYCQHLSTYRRYVWRSLAFLLSHVGAPVLRKLEL